MEGSIERRLGEYAEAIRNLRADMLDRIHEEERARKRLHDLEGLVHGLVDVATQQQKSTANRQKRLELRIQILTVAVGFAAVASPIIVALTLAGR